MKVITHKNCVCARGIIVFKCLKCGKKADNYMNGIEMCRECCEETSTCQICGKELNEQY